MFLGNLRTIRVHCWGGLGSQLYAWALLEDLMRDFPHRKVNLILHNSGVTKRESDVNFLALELSLSVIDDFKGNAKESSPLQKKRQRLNPNIRTIVKSILQSMGFLASANSDSEYRNIRSWTTDVRGHYSYRKISRETLALMEMRAKRCGQKWLSDDFVQSDDPQVFRVHIRLGDLLTLESKGPLSFEKIYSAIDQYNLPASASRIIYVASDSPELAVENFSKQYPLDTVISVVEDPWETISVLMSSGAFIGTNSKISVWVAILKFSQNKTSRVSLPNGAMNHFKENFIQYSELDSLLLY